MRPMIFNLAVLAGLSVQASFIWGDTASASASASDNDGDSGQISWVGATNTDNDGTSRPVNADGRVKHGHNDGHRNKGAAFDTFVKHFSASRPGTDTYLQTAITSLYPKSHVLVTQDYYFDIFRYAAAAGSSTPTGESTLMSAPVIIREDENIQSIKREIYLKPLRRRDGAGVEVETVVFGGWDVAWKEHEFKVIVATWAESFRQVTQWHIIADDTPRDIQAARSFIRACSEFGATYKDVVWVFEQGYWRADRGLWESVQKASWDDVVLDERFKKALQSDYRSFYRSEKTYKDLGVPWKRGLILLGPPGNGKTISLKALMKEVAVPTLYVKSFHCIKEVFDRARAEAPCVLILEDLDSLITDINRSFFLNQVDGLEDNDGLLIIGTTNHVERLDPALSSRPSRFDRKYTFPNPSRSQRRDYAIWWQDKLSTNDEIDFPDKLLDEFADRTGNFSFAYMKEAFISTLLTIASDKIEHGKDLSSINENAVDAIAMSEGNNIVKPDFQKILLEQVENLRKELESNPSLASSNGGPGSSSSSSSSDNGMIGAGGFVYSGGGGRGYGDFMAYRQMEEQERGQGSAIFQIPWIN
ncbi:hypothetical protein I316_07289 [Kwoniella heveanensis BCC8398]|uniref:AAA+ ATPase domain-containing protein n=1 Tax=Kwoniella heveanensis BCC8398 TaxID=1296120 RepID=A0A1B9GJ47_9TREE|nr:hypothetical protein I316_07289 [Kwoniella heveanensis BCC8398]